MRSSKPAKPRRTLAAAIAGSLIGVGVTVGSATCSAPAHADAIYHVAYTGIGIYPRAAADMGSAKVGAALPDGAPVDIQCETAGVRVTNGIGHSSVVWAQLTDGTWLPVIYLDTPGLGQTDGIPDCDPYPAGLAPEVPKAVTGLRAVSDTTDVDDLQVATQLLNHYYDKTGSDVVIDWNLFARDQTLMRWASTLPTDSIGRPYSSDPDVDGRDFYLALGHISFARTSQHCFAMKDTYDFAPWTPQWMDAQLGAAKPFTVRASGCDL